MAILLLASNTHIGLLPAVRPPLAVRWVGGLVKLLLTGSRCTGNMAETSGRYIPSFKAMSSFFGATCAAHWRCIFTVEPCFFFCSLWHRNFELIPPTTCHMSLNSTRSRFRFRVFIWLLLTDAVQNTTVAALVDDKRCLWWWGSGTRRLLDTVK